MTPFSVIINKFLGKITDDMYMELTYEDTIRDAKQILLDAIPYFEFPRFQLYAFDEEKETYKINLTDELFMHPSNYYLLDWIGLGKEKKKIYNYKYFGTSLYKFFGYNDNVSITKEINNNVYFKHNELPKIQKSLIYKENNLFVNDYLYKKISISNYFIKNLVQKINIFFNSFSK